MTSTKRLSPVAWPPRCPCSGLTLAKLLRPAMMTILAEGVLHGYRIIEKVAASPVMHGCRPDPAGVYRALRAMEREGLVKSSWDLSEKGPAKKCYRLTARGRACLERWVDTLAAYYGAIGQLLRGARAGLRRRPAAQRRRR